MRGLNGRGLVAAIEAELLADGCLIEVGEVVEAGGETTAGA